MTDMAQTVRVLQAMLLTDAERMLGTPTSWVFEMFKVHQGGPFLRVELQSPDYACVADKIPAGSASATKAADGRTAHLSLANTHPRDALVLTVKLAGISPTSAAGRLLTAPTMQAHNTFAAPDAVKPVRFEGVTLAGGTLTLTLPAKSVAVIELR
jgi:alpha-N-arabinofuranosidase